MRVRSTSASGRDSCSRMHTTRSVPPPSGAAPAAASFWSASSLDDARLYANWFIIRNWGLGTEDSARQTMSVGRCHHKRVVRGVTDRAARSIARLALAAVLAACTERAAATTDTTRGSLPEPTDSAVDQPSPKSAVPNPQTDTALSVG